MEPISAQIGQRLKEVRKKRGLTQEQLGEMLGLNYKYIGLIERGERVPSIQTLVRISEQLNVAIKEFFDSPISGRAVEKELILYRIWNSLKKRPKKDLLQAERVIKNLWEE